MRVVLNFRYSPNYVTDLSYNAVRQSISRFFLSRLSLGSNFTAQIWGQIANHGVIWAQKVGQAAAASTAGSYLQGHFAYPAAAQGGMVAPNGMMPVYPFYHYQYHGSQGLGVPATHFFPTFSATATATAAAAVNTVPAIISKPTVMAAPKGNKAPNTNKPKRRSNTSHVQPFRHSPCSFRMCSAARHFCRAKLAGHGMAGTRS